MRFYLWIWLWLVAITHSFAASGIPVEPEPMLDGPRVILPGHLHYTTSLLHRYNAQVTNPNLVVPPLELLIQDAQQGRQGWLPVVPDISVFPDYVVYPVYKHREDNGVLILILPSDEQSNIGHIIKERLDRFIRYTCLADGFPIPRMGRVQASDYQKDRGSWFGALLAGVLLGIALILLLRLIALSRR